MNLKSLSRYTRVDTEKMELIDGMMPRHAERAMRHVLMEDMDICENLEISALPIDAKITKVCPECGRKYPDYENFCMRCAVRLKDIEKVDIKAINVNHDFPLKGSHTYTDFNDILTAENLAFINDFDFTFSDFNLIVKKIRMTSLKNMDAAIKENSIDLDSLDILEKVILYAKSFVDVDYKSYGQELGFYSFNRIYVDDRQLDSLQITTILHELTHFLIKEILTQILSRILDASKTKEIESIIAFILIYSQENCLIDEYAAHTVEGRFTLFGYQDYSSFLNIQNSIERPPEEIEMLKTIGNTMANTVKKIIQSFIDDDMLSDIKSRFRSEVLDQPDYNQLRLENCSLLDNVGFMKALQFILLDGFAASAENIGRLMEINGMWDEK